jgi:F-type H+-transporting ATPase subunit b
MEELGINPVLLVAQIISFGVLFLVFKLFLFEKIQQALLERRQAVAKAFEDKAEMEKKLKEFEIEREKQRKDDELEAKKLLAESRKEALARRKEIVDLASREADNERQKGVERLKQETTETKEKLKEHVTDLASQMARELIKTSVDDEVWQRKKISLALKSLKHG